MRSRSCISAGARKVNGTVLGFAGTEAGRSGTAPCPLIGIVSAIVTRLAIGHSHSVGDEVPQGRDLSRCPTVRLQLWRGTAIDLRCGVVDPIEDEGWRHGAVLRQRYGSVCGQPDARLHPHKRLPDEQIWEKKGYRVTLWVEPGRMKSRGRVVTYGVPYGARARMILLYLQTQAVRTGSREVAVPSTIGGQTNWPFSRRLAISHIPLPSTLAAEGASERQPGQRHGSRAGAPRIPSDSRHLLGLGQALLRRGKQMSGRTHGEPRATRLLMGATRPKPLPFCGVDALATVALDLRPLPQTAI